MQKGVHAARLRGRQPYTLYLRRAVIREGNDWLARRKQPARQLVPYRPLAVAGTGLALRTGPPPAEGYKDRRCGGPRQRSVGALPGRYWLRSARARRLRASVAGAGIELCADACGRGVGLPYLAALSPAEPTAAHPT